jgi:hypothetical protein
MNRTFSGSKTKTTRVPAKVADAKRLSLESFSSEIHKNDPQFEKHDEQRILILLGIVTTSSQEKCVISFKRDESRMTDDKTMKREFPA